jgi:hypothetical protein
MINLDWSQLLSIVLAVVIIVFAVKEILVYHDASYWLVPLIIWQVLTIAFYVLLNLSRMNIIVLPVAFTDLSTILRMLGQITVAGVVVTWHLIHKLQGAKNV